jgi:hypothetical protein
MQNDLVVAREPRVKSSDFESHIKTNHPFFWSGYLLVAPGSLPPAAEAPNKNAVADEKKK